VPSHQSTSCRSKLLSRWSKHSAPNPSGQSWSLRAQVAGIKFRTSPRSDHATWRRCSQKLSPESIHPHTRLHLSVCKRHLVHHQAKMPDALLLDKERFPLQAQFASQPDSALQPHLHLASEWKSNFLGQLCGRSPPASDPLDVALAGCVSGVKIEFALTHSEESPLAATIQSKLLTQRPRAAVLQSKRTESWRDRIINS
jgi:hypothetical protein